MDHQAWCRRRGTWSVRWDETLQLFEPVLHELEVRRGRMLFTLDHDEPAAVGGKVVDSRFPIRIQIVRSSKSTVGLPAENAGSVVISRPSSCLHCGSRLCDRWAPKPALVRRRWRSDVPHRDRRIASDRPQSDPIRQTYRLARGHRGRRRVALGAWEIRGWGAGRQSRGTLPRCQNSAVRAARRRSRRNERAFHRTTSRQEMEGGTAPIAPPELPLCRAPSGI